MAQPYQSNKPGQRDNRSGWDNPPPRPSIEVADIKFAKPLSPNLFADIAQDKAKVIAQAGNGKKNKSTQLRKFYDELVMWNEKVQQTAERDGKYTELAPFIKMLKAKVAYAKGREHVDECFETLFSHVIGAISDADSLKHAKLFMEAFMGFYKAQESSKEK